ncbi:hypothetical protein OZX74_02565 [Bifidobacterium sp. ESL0798]|nr:hypothetical protein [Bifidobacterium sp. ESL0798]WEV74443.1 hypothetical protein OZX74_02565 [Bifidobacterium sp. ESL0798]
MDEEDVEAGASLLVVDDSEQAETPKISSTDVMAASIFLFIIVPCSSLRA